MSEQASAKIQQRPERLHGVTYRQVTPLGTAFVTINSDDEQPFEAFVNVGKAGSDTAAVAEAIGRLISLVLRLPCPTPPADQLKLVAQQLRGIGGGAGPRVWPEPGDEPARRHRPGAGPASEIERKPGGGWTGDQPADVPDR
jgi:hypothetical protein